MSFEYPLDYNTYSTEEIVGIIDFLSYLEEHSKHYDYSIFKQKYDKYRAILNSKIEEKRIDQEFEKLTGISIYHTARELGL